MPALKPITPHQRFYQEILGLRRKLDQLIVEYEATFPKEKYRRKSARLIDPETGKPFENKREKNNARKNGKKLQNISGDRAN